MRFVRSPDGFVVPDLGSKFGGRGASVHFNATCLKAACKAGFSRAFKAQIDVKPEALSALVKSLYHRRIEGLLTSGAGAKAVIVGTEAVREAVNKGLPRVLVVAEDAAGRRDELSARLESLGGHAVVFGTKTSLGRLFGRDELGILAIVDDGIADAVVEAATRAASYAEVE